VADYVLERRKLYRCAGKEEEADAGRQRRVKLLRAAWGREREPHDAALEKRERSRSRSISKRGKDSGRKKKRMIRCGIFQKCARRKGSGLLERKGDQLLRKKSIPLLLERDVRGGSLSLSVPSSTEKKGSL